MSGRYFDKYLPLSEPEILREVTDVMVEEIDKNIDAIAGVETGGIILATSLALQTNKALSLVRKQPKEYGTRKIIEGADVTGRNIVVVEDVITTGGAVLEAVSQIRQHGGHVGKVLCLMFRGDEAAKQAFSDARLTLVPVIEDSGEADQNSQLSL